MADIGTAFREAITGPWQDGYQFGDILNTAFSPLTGVNKWLDVTGSEAAQQQFLNQQVLDAQARAYNSAEAQKQRDFEERMSNTAIQRSVKDLEDAGLNKWLALQNGVTQASTPSGSSAASSSGGASMANNKLALAAGIIATALRIALTKH